MFYWSTSAVISEDEVKSHLLWVNSQEGMVTSECLNWPFLQISPVFSIFISIQIQCKKTAMLNDIKKKQKNWPCKAVPDFIQKKKSKKKIFVSWQILHPNSLMKLKIKGYSGWISTSIQLHPKQKLTKTIFHVTAIGLNTSQAPHSFLRSIQDKQKKPEDCSAILGQTPAIAPI